MNIDDAVRRILLGESMQQYAASYREQLLLDLGMDPEDSDEALFVRETHRFMSKVAIHLGEKYGGDPRASAALQDWVRVVDDYDAFDALLSNYEFPGRAMVVKRARILFPGPLTAHWD